MGLDSYVYATSSIEFEIDVDFEIPETDVICLTEWRNHWGIHRWFGQLYDQRGGIDSSFNVAAMTFDSSDLNMLAELLNSMGDEDEFFKEGGQSKQEDLRFVDLALQKMNDGFTMFYYGWY